MDRTHEVWDDFLFKTSVHASWQGAGVTLRSIIRTFKDDKDTVAYFQSRGLSREDAETACVAIQELLEHHLLTVETEIEESNIDMVDSSIDFCDEIANKMRMNEAKKDNK